jgi:hypothetical protein
MAAPEKLRILAFPQRIRGNKLDLNVLVIPTQSLLNPTIGFSSKLNPGTTVNLPPFIKGSIKLEVRAIKGLSSYPFSDSAALVSEGVTVESYDPGLGFPANLQEMYEGLKTSFPVDDAAGVSTPGVFANDDGIRKYLPRSYRQAFNFSTPRTEFARVDDSFHCAIKSTGDPDPAFVQSSNTITWGRAIAFCLRQPLLAEKMGLLLRTQIGLSAADYFADGGWIYLDLISDPGELGIVNPATEIKTYAARIPLVDGPRQLFAAVLFPVVANLGAISGQFDQLKIEASDYDDGFAKIVHVTQPVSANLLAEDPDGIHVQKELGFRMGWDDEQLLIWQNRQLLADPTTPGQRIDAPLGVFSYRVDVTTDIGKAKQNWNSLVWTSSKAALMLAGLDIAPAGTQTETGVQVFPSRINADPAGAYWLPSYFTQWYGASLVLPDSRAAQLDETGALADPGTYGDDNISRQPAQKTTAYEPVLPQGIEPKYGTEYEFRVRLADLSGGGPLESDNELNDAAAASATSFLRRYVAPKQLQVIPQAPQPNPDSATGLFFAGTSFDVYRPRLGYPALLFTQMDTGNAFKKLLDDRKFLHTGKIGAETIKEQREVSYFDPDVDQVMVIVDVKTILMDNLASRSQREAFIPLYQTFRKFPKGLDKPFDLELEYRDAHVIDFGNQVTLGDLKLSQKQIDAGKSIVVPTSRDVRITLLPVSADKPALPEYFGFAKTAYGEEFVRTGEQVQFYVRQNATEELDFFLPGLESHQLQGLYLQPDPTQVVNAATQVAEVVAGKESDQSTVVQRLAAQLGLESKGLSLVGQPGERIHFGCGNRIRHTLAPDGSSLTFATADSLINHWLCVLSFDLNRDWTWDGLDSKGVEIQRTRQFTGEMDTIEDGTVGTVELKKTASRLAITNPDRSRTRIVFIDAVEPKKEPGKQANPFPNTIDVSYRLVPHFIPDVTASSAGKQIVSQDLQLPVTVIPATAPVVVAAGMALSPYRHNDDYSETAVRERYLWLEFEQPILDPNDTYFARVLTYAPDPLLTFPSVDPLLVTQEDPPLNIDPELIRVITHGQGNDRAGLDAMDPMTPETPDPLHPLIKVSPVHFLLPIPSWLHSESPELFGFFTYELRVGHTERIWCTAQARYGHPLRLNGVQHPAPPLKCLVDRTPIGMHATAQHAVGVFNGKDVTSRPPKTEIWCMLYAQVSQADRAQNRNLLLAEKRLDEDNQREQYNVPSFLAERSDKEIREFNALPITLDGPAIATAQWAEDEIQALLSEFGLSADTGLSVMAVELMPRYDRFVLLGPAADDSPMPLSRDLGKYRILRTSRLMAVPEICCPQCA